MHFPILHEAVTAASSVGKLVTGDTEGAGKVWETYADESVIGSSACAIFAGDKDEALKKLKGAGRAAGHALVGGGILPEAIPGFKELNKAGKALGDAVTGDTEQAEKRFTEELVSEYKDPKLAQNICLGVAEVAAGVATGGLTSGLSTGAFVALNATAGAATSIAVNSADQGIDMAAGRRDHFDGTKLIEEGTAGAFVGTVMPLATRVRERNGATHTSEVSEIEMQSYGAGAESFSGQVVDFPSTTSSSGRSSSSHTDATDVAQTTPSSSGRSSSSHADATGGGISRSAKLFGEKGVAGFLREIARRVTGIPKPKDFRNPKVFIKKILAAGTNGFLYHALNTTRVKYISIYGGYYVERVTFRYHGGGSKKFGGNGGGLKAELYLDDDEKIVSVEGDNIVSVEGDNIKEDTYMGGAIKITTSKNRSIEYLSPYVKDHCVTPYSFESSSSIIELALERTGGSSSYFTEYAHKNSSKILVTFSVDR